MSELTLFGNNMFDAWSRSVSLRSLYISNSKGDDERFKESIGNMCWGATVVHYFVAVCY